MPIDPTKFPNRQSHVDAQTAFRRLYLARAYLKLTQAFADVAFPQHGARRDLDMLLVLMAVGIGDGDGRPMSATRIARLTGIPRATIHRKLESLIKFGKITRTGNVYRYAPDGMRPDRNNRLQKAVEELCSIK